MNTYTFKCLGHTMIVNIIVHIESDNFDNALYKIKVICPGYRSYICINKSL